MFPFLALFVAAIILSGSPEAWRLHSINGVFCNEESQIDNVLAQIQRDVPLWLAVEVANVSEVACVHARTIRYVVSDPILIGQIRHRGTVFPKYEATLVGVLVGDNLRPIEPSVPIYFISADRLPGVAAAQRV